LRNTALYSLVRRYQCTTSIFSPEEGGGMFL
jgi:hypothetical protein